MSRCRVHLEMSRSARMVEMPLFEVDEDGLVVVELLMIRWEEVDFVVVL